MSSQSWGSLFAIVVCAVGSIALYGLAYFVLLWFGLVEPHLTSVSLLVGVSGAFGLNLLLTAMDKPG
jgi:hypothetical protein